MLNKIIGTLQNDGIVQNNGAEQNNGSEKKNGINQDNDGQHNMDQFYATQVDWNNWISNVRVYTGWLKSKGPYLNTHKIKTN